MKLGLSGGGFFFKPFSRTISWSNFTIFPNAGAGVYGAWAHTLLLPFTLTIKSRWLEIVVYSADMGAGRTTYHFQLGQGSAGNETVLLPTSGSFRYTYDPTLPCNPHRFSFPYLMQPGFDLAFRCMANIAGASPMYANIYVWD